MRGDFFMKTFDPNRREALKKAGMAGIGAVAAGFMFGSVARAMTRTSTPPQPEGPFYPVKDQLDKDADMTQVASQTETATGQRVRLTGQVIDITSGAAVTGAVVEFWQACESGKYNHPKDTNDAPLDPYFQYWAQVRSDQNGDFGLLTIKPGAYPADGTWVRPPHIHVKVHKPGYPSLTTQIYFAGDTLNDSDKILQRLTPAQRSMVTVDFKKDPSTDFWNGSWTIFIAPFVSGRLLHEGQEIHSTTPELD
jgi:protocatechuate 3,4-dioxygenase, beta subunit